MDKIKGYKAFNKDMSNRYGKKFEEGMIYSMIFSPRFGNDGRGYHFCKRLEDTLRFFRAMEEEIQIAEVTGLGETVTSDRDEDEYYGYYDMYSTNKIRIDKILTREEIIKMALAMPPYRVTRFIQGYKLTPDEIEMFRLMFEKDNDVQLALSYYQEHQLDAYELDYKKHH